MEFLKLANYKGLIIGGFTFLVIGLFHPLVIKVEYYWGQKGQWLFGLLGVSATLASLIVANDLISIAAGVVGFSSFWSIKEVSDQEKRVLEGRYPKNPKRKYK